jgi:acyl carrier protein
MPNRETIRLIILEILATLTSLPEGASAMDVDDLPLVDGGVGLDSVRLMELIGLLEERLGFLFEESDLRVKSFSTLGSLADVIALRVGTDP